MAYPSLLHSFIKPPKLMYTCALICGTLADRAKFRTASAICITELMSYLSVHERVMLRQQAQGTGQTYVLRMMFAKLELVFCLCVRTMHYLIIPILEYIKGSRICLLP